MTNYYIRKFVYLGWNKADDKIQTMPKSIFFLRWTQMCLTFAEAANRVSGPTTPLYGYTPKQAIAYLRTSYDFLENHLLNWVPMLVADMRMHARTLFYQGLGQLTFGTLQEDETVLRELLDSVEA